MQEHIQFSRSFEHKMAVGILKVKGNKVVDNDGNEVLLRGAAIGGWMKYAVTQFLYFTF